MDTARGETNLSLQKRNAGHVDLSGSETWIFQEEAVLLLVKWLRRNPMHPVNQTAREVQKLKEKEWSHNLHVSPATVHHTEAVFSTVKRIYGREHDDTVD